MSGFTRVCRLLVCPLVLLAASAQAAGPTTIAQLLAYPASFDGKHVDVKGRVQKLEQTASTNSNRSVTFSLCSSQCVEVIGFGSPGISNGEMVTVHGLFTAVKQVSGYIFYEKIDAQ
jgi:hypothetical protein